MDAKQEIKNLTEKLIEQAQTSQKNHTTTQPQMNTYSPTATGSQFECDEHGELMCYECTMNQSAKPEKTEWEPVELPDDYYRTVAAIPDIEDVCPTCGTPANVGLMRSDAMPGERDFGKLIKCNHEFHQQTREQRLQKISQLGPDDVKRQLSDIGRNPGNAAMLDAAQDAIKTGYGWYYLWGGPGNAKSEVLKAIVNDMNKTGRGPAVYTTFGRLLMYMRAAFNKDAGQSEIARFDELVRVRCLAVDEMDKPKESDWMLDFRFQFLDARYISAVNGETLTIYAGNPNPKIVFDEVMFDRFRDGRFMIVQNTAKSARPAQRWNK